MTETDPKTPNTRQAPRAPIETKVHLEFEKFSGFITEYSSNISEGGMFIKTMSPKPLGTVLSFEFKLADNFKLIQGLGEVAWVRSENLSEEKPAGMGVRFVDVDQQSRELITTMVHNYMKRGGDPFQLEGGEPVGPVKTEAAPTTETPPPDPIETSPSDPMLDTQDLFAMTDDVTETISPPPGTPEVPETPPSDDPAAGPVETDFQALFEVSDESIAIPGEMPQEPQVPAPETASPTTPPPAAPTEEPSIDIGQMIEDEAVQIPAPESSPPIVDLLEPEVPERKAKKPVIRRRRRAIKINATTGIIVAAVVGIGSAVYFRNQITTTILKFMGNPGETKEAVLTSLPRVKPTAQPAATAAPTEVPVEDLTKSAAPATETKPNLQPTIVATVQPTVAPTIVPTAQPTITPTTIPTIAPKVATSPTGFGSLQSISWERTGTEFVLILTADAPFPPKSFFSIRVTKGSPREVIKLVGIKKPFAKAKVAVNAPEVLRVRTGFHATKPKHQLHIVADLGDPNVRIKRMEPDGRNLRIYLGK